MHFEASSLHFWERVKSYRAFKATGRAWDRAQPVAWSPSLRTQGSRRFVSWNGATTLASWELQGQQHGDHGLGDFETFGIKARQHFEESFDVPAADVDGLPYVNIRAVALDAEDRVLDYSNISPAFAGEPWSRPWTWFLVGTTLCMTISAVKRVLRVKCSRFRDL